MKTLSAKWYEVAVRHEQADNEKENRRSQNVETLAVDAATFAEAEQAAVEYVAVEYPGETEAVRMSVAQYSFILVSEESDDEARFYHAKIAEPVVDERTGRERVTLLHLLVQAANIGKARENINKVYTNSLLDYEIKSIVETNITGIVTHNND